MDLPHRPFTTSRNLTYSYIHIPPSTKHEEPKPYILFLHGFPSLAVDFHKQISFFSHLGYGIVAPDLLGYGASSMPTDSSAYLHKNIVEDIVEILNRHSIGSVYGVAHDFGVQMLTRLEFYHPDVVIKMAFLTIGFGGIAQTFDLDAVNSMTKEMLGFEGYGYIDFLVRNQKANYLLKNKHDSFTSLMFAENHDLWKHNFAKLGGLQNWLNNDRMTSTIPSFDNNLARAHRAAFEKENGYLGPIRWYQGLVHNLNLEDDRKRLIELDLKDRQYQLPTRKPLLLLASGLDCLATPAVQKQMTESYAPHVKVEVLPTGHWCMLEQPEMVNQSLDRLFADDKHQSDD